MSPTASGRRPHLLVLSADAPDALERDTDDLAGTLTNGSGTDLAAIARQLHARPALPHRRAILATEPARAAQHLYRRDPRFVATGHAEPGRPVVFMCAGVGDQYAGMAAGLARALPVFRQELTRCLRAMEAELGLELTKVLYPDDPVRRRGPSLAAMLDHHNGPADEIHQTTTAQPLLFATQYAMAITLQTLGPRPSALVGYSIGEYVAACIAGVIRLDDALRLVARRARLVADLPEGGMLAVAAGPQTLAAHLGDEVAVAALNGPELTVVSGPTGALADIGKRLAARDIASQPLSTSHAFHSPMMDPVVAPLRELVATFELRTPGIPMQSNGTGTWMHAEATSPDYWAGHLRNPVRFADNVAELWQLPDPVLIELGPGQALGRLASQSPARPAGRGLTVPTLPGPLEKRPDLVVLLTAIGHLWTAGCPVSFPELFRQLDWTG
jgi:acyl transferase domain-containing protein